MQATAQTPAPSSVASSTNDRWPPQIKFIVGNEAAERFSYYGMKSILALYITTALLQTKDTATTIIHLFGFANYFMPLLGAWVSDKFWGRYHTILWVSLSYCVGHGVLATSDLFGTVDAKLVCLYVGLGLIAFGSGGIKPCVSAFMGDQFGPDQTHLMRKAYGAFYFSINFGSFFSFLVIPWIASPAGVLGSDAGILDRMLWQFKHAGFAGYGWAFGVPGIAMGLATLIFWLGTKHYVRKPPSRVTRTAGFFKVFVEAFRSARGGRGSGRMAAGVSVLASMALPALAMMGMVTVAMQHTLTPFARTIGWASLACVGLWYVILLGLSIQNHAEIPEAFWNPVRGRFSEAEIAAARSVVPILTVFAFVVPFWSLFEQSNSTWVLQGAQMVPFRLLGLTVGAEQMQSLNPLLVMILVPVLTWGAYPLVERLGMKMTPLRRIAAGLLITALSFVMVSWLQQRIGHGEQLSLAWQAMPYILLTAGEVLVSTTGLEFAYTQAPPSMKSAIMSFWLLAISMGNVLVATITQLGGGHGDESVSAERFLIYAGMLATVGVLFIVVAIRYRYREDASPHAK